MLDPSSSRAMTRCSTETYSSLSRLASRSAASSRRESRWVTNTCPGAAPGPGDAGPAAELGLHVLAQPVRVGAACASSRGDQALALVQQRQQQVLAVDLGVAETERLGLRVVQCLLRLLGQAVQVQSISSSGCVASVRCDRLELRDPVEQVDAQGRARRS